MKFNFFREVPFRRRNRGGRGRNLRQRLAVSGDGPSRHAS
jgi:hypothetical protein